METINAIVIGRHELSGTEGLEVIRQENINFPATSEECEPILEKLLWECYNLGVALIFQVLPGQVSSALHRRLSPDQTDLYHRIGVIINKPGERPSNIKKEFSFFADYGLDNEGVSAALGKEAVKLVNFINPHAKVKSNTGLVTVTVDPPLRFEFSHIEWF